MSAPLFSYEHELTELFRRLEDVVQGGTSAEERSFGLYMIKVQYERVKPLIPKPKKARKHAPTKS